jgi:hypothetical protein
MRVSLRSERMGRRRGQANALHDPGSVANPPGRIHLLPNQSTESVRPLGMHRDSGSEKPQLLIPLGQAAVLLPGEDERAGNGVVSGRASTGLLTPAGRAG